MNVGKKRLEYERIFSGEFSVLEHARMTMGTPQDPEVLQIEYQALAGAFEKLLRQAVRLTSTGDKIEQKLLQTQQNLNDKVAQVQALNRDLQRVNAEKTEFLEILSHDLRSPLTAVLTVLGLLHRERAELPADKVDELLENSTQSIENATDLIETILEASRIESGHVEVELGPCKLDSLVQVHVKMALPAAAKKNIQVEVPDAYPAETVMADPQAVARILDNLLSNAVKYTPPGKRVWVNLVREGNEVRCEVGDTGPGLTEDDMALLFQKYRRLSSRPTGRETSTGLGLAIAKGLAERMNARLWCESVYGQGCRFNLALPVYNEARHGSE